MSDKVCKSGFLFHDQPLLCNEDAFETYLPASMIPSENVISSMENGSSRSCRFHKVSTACQRVLRFRLKPASFIGEYLFA